MRRIHGVVVFPADAPATTALLIVELRDVSYADDSASLVASTQITAATVRPHGRCPFEFEAPEMPMAASLSLRCHIDLSGDGTVMAGDLLSTQSLPIPTAGDAGPLVVPVVVI
ncbi:hypothetical protein ACFWPX_02945 [Nocardia sp. NPDC058518]|uniref:hypothetical protein n=1 Tax=Nocardia sp. NPDC058518 TaxID=3346534 RepID=UPI00365810A4